MNGQKLYQDYIEEMYENLTELSTGNMGRTYLARNRVSGKIVVKKYIPVQTGNIYERLKEISNPNLAGIYEVCSCQEYCAIIEEYISGETLENILEEVKILQEEVVTAYLIQILKALQIVHNHGIVHRDLTPANILISTDNIPKLIDFGIARNPKRNQSQDTMILGTLGYASPEQFGFRQTDGRADIYAIGILINKMLTGKLPNEKLTENKKYQKIVEKCIQIDPDKRYYSVEQILEQIEEKLETWEKDVTIWPGFRCDILWRKVVACVGYACMLLLFVVNLDTYGQTISAFFGELIALGLYICLPFLIGSNFGRWDRRLAPFSKMPKALTIIIRIILACWLFLKGINLETYIQNSLL